MDKLYVLAGKARSGKDTVANFIENYYKDKKIIKLMYGRWVKDYALMMSDWDGNDDTKPRQLLQQIATHSRKINPDYIIRRMEEDINILKDYFDIIIITDARMPEEVIMPKEKFNESVTIKIVRTNFETPLSLNEQKDLTETALDDYNDYDYIIENNGDLDNLNSKVTYLIERKGM